MTVCNMSIEAGARAGHDRARRDHLRLPRGPAVRAAATSRRAPSSAGASCRPTRARASTARSSSTRARSSRMSPGAPTRAWSRPITGARADRPTTTRSGRRDGVRRALEYMGLERGRGRRGHRRSTASSSARAPTARIEDLRAAAERRARPHASPAACARWSCPARAGQGARPRPRGSTDLQRRRLRVARAGCSMCLAHEPRHPAAGRALRLDQQPQLRGPPGQGRPHAPGQPADGRRRGDRRPLRRRPLGRIGRC